MNLYQLISINDQSHIYTVTLLNDDCKEVLRIFRLLSQKFIKYVHSIICTFVYFIETSDSVCFKLIV